LVFGFTLVELLVVIAILSILAVVGLGQYSNAQKKAKDAQRKADLSSIQRGLEMYFTDNEGFPGSLTWGQKFSLGEIVYVKMLPENTDSIYAYEYDAGEGGYRLYAVLESEDPCDTYTVGVSDYCYVVTSPNLAVPTLTP